MKTYSQDEIDGLIRCPKIVTEPPKKEMRLERGSRRNDMKVASKDGQFEFRVFMRVNEDFPENFSIGLDYSPKDERGSLCLLRCNGPHGEFLGTPIPPHPHFLHHVHRAKTDNLAIGLRSEIEGEAVGKYASYKQALRYFLQATNVTDAEEFYPSICQESLSFGEEDQTQ